MKLKEYRQWKGYTVTELADKIGISQPYLTQIEKGSRPASRRAAMLIRRATGGNVDYEDLFGEVDAEKISAQQS